MSPAARAAAAAGLEPQVAVVHDYFTQRGGAELVAARLAGLFPRATLHAAVVDPDALPDSFAAGDIRTTPLKRLLTAGVPLRALAPLLPLAFGRMDLGSADVIISSSSAFAHHVRVPRDAVHIGYCHTPPRFLWTRDEYFRDRGLERGLAAPALAVLRRWDSEAAARVDIHLANSRYTAARIQRTYGRTARVVYPPVETSAFAPSSERSGRFLVVARLRPHKRIDLAIAAANELGVGLDVIGEGSDLARLRGLAGPTVRFLGRRSGREVAAAMASCAGLVVPGIEDFGMATVEVQAAGRPPIAFAEGGPVEIIRDDATGFLFTEQTPAAIGGAMLRALREPVDSAALVESARRFDTAIFDRTIREIVTEAAGRAADPADPRFATGPAADPTSERLDRGGSVAASTALRAGSSTAAADPAC